MSAQTILLPTILLVLWSLVMLLWTVATRFPAIAKNMEKLRDFPVGGRGELLNDVLPPKVMWKAHNYDHLLQQPTLFYATVFVLVALEQGNGTNTALAWAYLVSRIVHSLWQALINTVLPMRVALFSVSSTILIVLAVRAFWSAWTILL
jgi:hypothetical protein